MIAPSAEVIAEEIMVALDESGLPREEQGELIREYVRAVAVEVAFVAQAAYAQEES